MLGFAPAALGIQPSLPGCKRRLGLPAEFGLLCGFADQLDQPIHGVLAVALLASKSLGSNNQCALLGHSTPSQAHQTLAHVSGQGRGVVHIEAELYGGGSLVDVLAARPRSSDEVEFDFVLVNDDGGRDVKHSVTNLIVIQINPEPIQKHETCGAWGCAS